MTKYVALLRGINVGGKAMIKMADLKVALSDSGLLDVQTYIQSGNVIFSSAKSDKHALGSCISTVIDQRFKLEVAVAVFTAHEWGEIIKNAPKWWGKDPTWKHNLLILTESLPIKDVIAAIGELKPDIEAVEAGNRVVYQSMSFTQFGKTTTGKLASNPVYKKMTIRNYNTATKLAALLD